MKAPTPADPDPFDGEIAIDSTGTIVDRFDARDDADRRARCGR